MSLLESFDKVSRPFATVTSFVDTGATSLVAAPGTGLAIAVTRLFAIPVTTTGGFNDLSFRQNGTTTGLRFWTGAWALSAGSTILDREFDPPWILDENQPLIAVLSLTASSTPTVYVNATYRIFKVT